MKTIVLVLMLFAATATARADDSQPWAVGVTAEQKAAAQALLDAGNQLLLDRQYVEALDKYRAAIAVWDHPAIHFNIVRCLIHLDRPAEASESLKLALKYGAAPLDDTVYGEALAYEKLLASQIGELAVSCSQAKVEVTLDGQPFTTCPATQRKRVAPGRHQIVARRAGYLTKTIDLVVVGGAVELVDIKLFTLEEAGTLTRRWPKWVPWVVLASGVTAGILAGSLQLKAQGDMARYNASIDRCGTAGCPDEALDIAARDRARLENKLAIGLGIAGAATVITGGVLLYLNRAQLVVPVEVQPAQRGAGAVLSYSADF